MCPIFGSIVVCVSLSIMVHYIFIDNKKGGLNGQSDKLEHRFLTRGP